MSTIRSFVRREPVLFISALAALITCFFVPPDGAYLSYLDFRTLSLLYCLMTVVNGLRQAGLFSHLAHSLCEKAASLRAIAVLLVLLCFFTSMPSLSCKVGLLLFCGRNTVLPLPTPSLSRQNRNHADRCTRYLPAYSNPRNRRISRDIHIRYGRNKGSVQF